MKKDKIMNTAWFEEGKEQNELIKETFKFQKFLKTSSTRNSDVKAK